MANCNAANNVSQLVSSLTSLPRVIPTIFSSNLSNTSEVEDGLLVTDQIIHSWWWGAVIGIVCVGLLALCCLFYCCVCCCVCCGKTSYGKSYKCPKVCCGLFTVTLLALSIIVLSLVIWLETRVDSSITSFTAILPDVVINTTGTISPDNLIGEGLLIVVEEYRFIAGLAVGGTVIFFLLLSVLAFICAPCCKSPAAIVIVMVLHVFLILVLALYACVTFALTVFGSHICLEVYKMLCSTSVATPDPVDTFCNGTVEEMLAIVLMLCATALVLFSLQFFGSIYARLISKSKKQYKVETVNGQSSEMFIGPPHSAAAGTKYVDGGVWDAYGTQSVMGVKSGGQHIPTGYSPEAYPMGAVAPVAPIAPLPMEGYDDVKEVTLHVHEVEASQLSMSDMYPSRV